MKNALNRLRATWNPDMYHGWGVTKRYFEGWYIKIVDDTEEYALAFIPGISMGRDGNHHAFIQTIDGKKCETTYHRFSVSDFQPSEKGFELRIGDNEFSAHKIKIHLPAIKGELTFENITPWTPMLGAPGIMGWFSFMPFMECYHGVVSLNHRIKGTLNVAGNNINFTKGLGYIEKDWGVSFPNAYIWMQTNHFFDKNKALVEQPNNQAKGEISLIASVANIPFLGTHFIGYIVGFWFQNKLYRFATYTGAQILAQLDGRHIRLAFKDTKNRLEIDAHQAETGSLIYPINGEMVGKLNESLKATIHVRFYEKDRLVFEGLGRNAGLEAAGNVDILLTEKWCR